MRTRKWSMLVVAGLLLVGVTAAIVALAAPPGPGIGHGERVPVPVKRPDLMIASVKIEQTGRGEFPNYDFTVTLVNKGAGPAGATTLGALSINDITVSTTGAGIFLTIPTPSIAAGERATVTTSMDMAPLGRMYFVFVADAPVPGKPLGRRTEEGTFTSGKGNNSFVVAYDSADGNPQTFTNTAAR